MPRKVKGYFYHISQHLPPEDCVLSPRSWGENRDEGEPKIARVCVCPTISGCITAIAHNLFARDVRVFRTKRQVTAVIPFGKNTWEEINTAVADSFITKERWLLRPIHFKFVGYFDANQFRHLFNYVPGDPSSFYDQEICMKEMLKLEKSSNLLG